ncbi:MAG: response regulator [Pyrinomonadaceae bacterium]
MTQNILVVDDDPELHDLITFALKRHGYDVVSAPDAFAGLRILSEMKVDLAMLDIMMPRMDGLEMLSKLREDHPDLRVIMMTAISTPEAAVAALRDEACDFLAKPFDIADLISAVDTALSMQPHGHQD